MKLRTVLCLSVIGSIASSVSVYAFTQPEPQREMAAASLTSATSAPGSAVRVSTRFAMDATVALEGRVGHSHLVAGGDRETYLVLEARGTEPQGAVRAPLTLALVIDRSGSMEGTRIAQALRAARGVVERLRDGDFVTVVSFDDTARVMVPATEVSQSSRESIGKGIDQIGLGDTTCISCGIETALAELDKNGDRVRQMIVLSDGKANMGIQKSAGFAEMSDKARARGVAISTVGVGLAYDERFLSTISAASNGQHHFVENDSGLPALFEAAAKTFTSTVASEVRAEIDLGPGVELLQVLDRSFERRGQRVVVPLGSLSRGETKTVLLKVRVPESEGVSATVADIQMLYDDHARSTEGRTRGKLEVALFRAGRAAAELDPFVAERVERSRTGALLKEANELLRNGKGVEARGKLAAREAELDDLAQTLPKAARADSRRGDIDRQLQEQRRVTARAKADLAPRPGAAPAAPPASVTVAPSLKQNEVDAFKSTR